MTLQAALSLKRNSATVDNPIVALSLTVNIISITIAYHSYRLHQKNRQQQKAINKEITTICKILKEDIVTITEAEKQLKEINKLQEFFPNCNKTKEEESQELPHRDY